MSYYLRTVAGSPMQVWKIDDRVAVCVGVTNPDHGAGTYFKADPGETIWDAIRRQTPWFEPDGQNPLHEAELQPGEYYPRIARPVNFNFRRYDVPGLSASAREEVNLIAIARSQLTVLTRQLDRICQTVHPTVQT